jgi:transposase
VDEFGPLELRPYAGRSWQRAGHPVRLRATYTRPHGVRYLFGAYEVATGRLWGRMTRRKRAHEFAAFLQTVRATYAGRVWIVLDNLSTHKTQAVRDWARIHNVRLQFLPTNASWLNRIECQFTHLKKNVLTHADYPSFATMGTAIHRYLRWWNRRQTRLLCQNRH